MREDLEQRLRRHLPNLDAAAIPTKCEVFTICGSEARDLHDAIEEATALISAARKGQGEWRGIETAPKDEPILASTTGKVWFQANWGDDDGEWVTFNRYLESDLRQPDRKWLPKIWMPLPPPPEQGE